MALSRRQWNVARLVADGLQNAEIAAASGFSLHCVKNDIHVILNETGMNTRLELALWYVAVGEGLNEQVIDQ